MNGIDDLRRTLETHADDVLGVAAVERGTGIQRRVRIARRRRAAAGATAAIVAVAAVVALVPGDRASGPDPTGPTVFGIDIPEELDSLGFTYEYAEHVRGEERAVLDLQASDVPRLVSWGTSTNDDRVVVTVGAGGTQQTYDGADFADWTYIAEGYTVEVSARASDGDVALAVYTLGDDRPEGVTAQGVTFRDVRAGAPLLGAAIGEPGEAEVVVEPTERAAEVFYATFCAGGPPNAVLHVEIATGEFMFGNCSDTDLPTDPAAFGGSSQAAGPRQDLTTRLYVTAGPDGPMVVSDDLRIGIGLYAEPTKRPAAGGTGAPEILEEDGHLWRLVDLQRSERGADGLSAEVPVSDRPLTVRAIVGGTKSTWSMGVDGEMSSTFIGGSGSTGSRLDSGAGIVHLVAERGSHNAGAEWAIAFYEMAD